MSNQEFENYCALIGKLLQLTREQREQISGELQDHLQMRVADLVAEGVAKQDAIAQALEEFGDAAVMAKNFQTVLNLKRRRWMMRFATISMAAAFLATILTMALWPENTRFGAPANSVAQDADAAPSGGFDPNAINQRLSDATQRDFKTEEALKQVIDLNYEETPFSEIMEELSKLTGLNFLLDNSARDDSLTEDEPLTFRIRQLPLDKSLELMLIEKNATYVIDSGVVVFISRDVAEDASYMRLKMFDCRELVNVLPESYSLYQVESPGGGGISGGGGLGGGGGMFCVTQGASSADPIVEQIKPVENQDESRPKAGATSQSMPRHATSDATLLNLVFSMVDPESWEHSGNGMASAKVVNGILVVRQKETAFRKIENLLIDLHANVLPAGKTGEIGIQIPLRDPRGQAQPGHVSQQDPFGERGQPRKSAFGKGESDDSVQNGRKNPFSQSNSANIGDPFGS